MPGRKKSFMARLTSIGEKTYSSAYLFIRLYNSATT
jgi:hypothetical protein